MQIGALRVNKTELAVFKEHNSAVFNFGDCGGTGGVCIVTIAAGCKPMTLETTQVRILPPPFAKCKFSVLVHIAWTGGSILLVGSSGGHTSGKRLCALNNARFNERSLVVFDNHIWPESDISRVFG